MSSHHAHVCVGLEGLMSRLLITQATLEYVLVTCFPIICVMFVLNTAQLRQSFCNCGSSKAGESEVTAVTHLAIAGIAVAAAVEATIAAAVLFTTSAAPSLATGAATSRHHTANERSDPCGDRLNICRNEQHATFV